LTQFVGHDVINKNTTDLAVRCSTGSVEFSSVQLSCVAINTPLGSDSGPVVHMSHGVFHCPLKTRLFSNCLPPQPSLSSMDGCHGI